MVPPLKRRYVVVETRHTGWQLARPIETAAVICAAFPAHTSCLFTNFLADSELTTRRQPRHRTAIPSANATAANDPHRRILNGA